MRRTISLIVLLACAAIGSAADATTATSSSPSPTPTPTPNPNMGFILRYQNESVCLHMEGNFTMHFNFTTVNSTKDITKVSLPVMNPKMVSGSECSGSSAVLKLEWNHENISYNLAFRFQENMGKRNWSLSDVMFNFMVENNPFFDEYSDQMDFPDLSASLSDVFEDVSLNYSFKCKSLVNHIMAVPGSNGTLGVIMAFQNLQVQAFAFPNATSGAYGSGVKVCDADSSSSRSKVVPIAVGCALAGLVIIVLVAYLIGRFRSRKQEAYETLS